MFSLAISFGPQGMVWSLLFKDEARARAALQTIELGTDAAILHVVDDFGQEVSIMHRSYHGALIQDLDQMIESRIQHSLNDAKAQARFNQRAKTDPEIRALQNGPAVLSPGFRN